MSTARKLDQFYTSRTAAATCLNFLNQLVPLSHRNTAHFLEPSAGDGAFLELLPPKRRTGIDVDPRHQEVATRDFLLEFIPPQDIAPWIVVGNPPFGKNSSKAARFFNKSAEFADVIAFVVPRTFRKASLQRRLHASFELLGDLELPDDSFIFEDKPYSVPCCFQVWRRTNISRSCIALPLTDDDFIFCRKDQADFAFRRIGALAGKIIRDFANYSPSSHFFVRAVIDIDILISRFERLSWEDTKWNTAGNPSVSKRELVQKYSSAYADTTASVLPRATPQAPISLVGISGPWALHASTHP